MGNSPISFGRRQINAKITPKSLGQRKPNKQRTSSQTKNAKSNNMLPNKKLKVLGAGKSNVGQHLPFSSNSGDSKDNFDNGPLETIESQSPEQIKRLKLGERYKSMPTAVSEGQDGQTTTYGAIILKKMAKRMRSIEPDTEMGYHGGMNVI